MNFYDCVRAHENDLNAGEYEILKYVIANRGDLSGMTTKAVAGHFFVAPNTITRMAHKLGFKGFSELKASLLVSMGASEHLDILRQQGIRFPATKSQKPPKVLRWKQRL